MKHVFLVFFLFSIVSCSKDKDQLQSTTRTIVVDEQTYQVGNLVEANENCNTIYIGLLHSAKFPYVMQLSISKKGDVLTAQVADHQRNYESLFFNPTETFHITSFEYDTLQATVSLDFEATLFSSLRTNSKTIKGTLTNLSVKPTACSVTLDGLETELESSTGKKERIYSRINSAQTDPKSYAQYYYTNNGYRIVLSSNSNLINLKSGTHPISSDPGSPLRITFEKYLGRTDQVLDRAYVPAEWRSYRVEGETTISHSPPPDGQKTTTGLLTFSAYDLANKAAYHVNKGKFMTTNIGN